MKIPWEISTVKLSITKHFSLKYMRSWGWNFHDLREAIREAYKIEKVGKEKYEIYCQTQGYKKVIVVYYNNENELVCVTGSEGGKRK